VKLFDIENKRSIESEYIPEEYRGSEKLFIICNSDEAGALSEYYRFDESTVSDCSDSGENAHFISFDGYDFLSVMHMGLTKEHYVLKELNLYVSERYLVLVIPATAGDKLDEFEARAVKLARTVMDKQYGLDHIYFLIINLLLADYSEVLNEIEDRMEALSEKIIHHAEKSQFVRIYILRRAAYTAKKHLRALSYVGEQMLVNENMLIQKKNLFYFRSLDTQVKKMYDFAETLYHLGTGLTDTYDSKMSTKTNEMINKLTVITVIFAPLTLIAGIYGMNFAFMPELEFRYAYFVVLAAMVFIAVALYWVLKNKKWL